ncbi:hypothetical protein LTR85_003243 [Meristemomyces frigidus]|nr:hypothetical protein LTR85_003243 [Meristemomyces frigidus]
MNASTATLRGLGLIAKGFLWLGMPATTAYIAKASPTTASLLPVILLPTFWSVYKRRSMPLEHREMLESLAYIFWTVGTIGVFAVIVMQSLGSYGLARVLFGSRKVTSAYMREFGVTTIHGMGAEDISKRAQMAWRWEYFALLASFTYMLAGGLEELLKYAPIVYMRPRVPASTPKVIRAKLYLQYALAAALGFSTLENVGFTMAALKSGERAPGTAVTVAERVTLSAPGHMLCAAMLAINAVDEEGSERGARSLWRTLGTSVLYHGRFHFMLFAISAWNGNVGWIHPTDATSIIVGLPMVEVFGLERALAMQVWRGWQALRTKENEKPVGGAEGLASRGR